MSPDINMHYGTSFTIVGEVSGNKDFDALRYRTTNKEQFNVGVTKFGGRFGKRSTSMEPPRRRQ